MKPFFITGTGTDIGKTFITCMMVRHLRAIGEKVAALKPVASGFDADHPEKSDSGMLLESLGKKITVENVNEITPFHYHAPLAPAHAAMKEMRPIDIAKLEAFCTAPREDIVLIEGAGGVMVPLADHYTTLDLMQKVGAPVILVAGTYLGSISHTLTALETLHHAGLKIAGVIVNGSKDAALSTAETAEAIKHWAKNPPRIFTVERQTTTNAQVNVIPHLLEILQDV